MSHKSWIWLAALALHLTGNAQTQIDFPRQAKDVAGTTLPATCSPGQIFVNLTTPAGQNVYVCTSTNTWSLEAGGSGGGGGASWVVTRTSARVLTVTCPSAPGCIVNIGGTVYNETEFAGTITEANAHTGMVSIFLDGTNTVNIYYGPGSVGGGNMASGDVSASCTGSGCAVAATFIASTGAANIPNFTLPIEQWNSSSTAGNWDATGIPLAGTSSVQLKPSSGPGITIGAVSGGAYSVSSNGSGGSVVQLTTSCTFNSTCAVSNDSGTEFNSKGSTLTDTLPAAPPTMPWFIAIVNDQASSTALTIARNGNTINGVAANLVLQPGQSVTCASDTVTGSNYLCPLPGYPGGTLATTPADNATCTAGQFWWDTGFIYICTASGTVKRATLATY